MTETPKQQGFMKILVVVTVGFCILFILAFKFAQYFTVNMATSPSRGTVSRDYRATTNPLLDFGGLGGFTGSPSGGTRITPNTDGTGSSPYSGRVSLGYGNARSSAQPFEEYVTIRNRGEAVNITGWRLENGRGSRPMQNTGNEYFYGSSESAYIGQGTEFLSPNGVFQTGPIVLKNGDTAIVTTGRPFSQYAFSITTSFRENMCLGYLEHFPFDPSVQLSCPAISSDPLIRTVTDQCYDYIRRIRTCRNPQTYDKERFEALTGQCQSFILSRTTYAGCVEQNSNRSDFASDQWRVFLGRGQEMWASRNETITLYDNNGFIVDQVSY